MPLTFKQAGWVTAGGVVLVLPAGWQDTSEVTFVVPGATKEYLIWGIEGFDAGGAVAELEKRRKKTLDSELARHVTEIEQLPHPRWPVFTFNALSDIEPDSVVYAVFMIVRPFDTLALRVRTTNQQLGSVRAALTSLWPRPLGTPPVPGRYVVYDVSFAWPCALLPPRHYSFEAEDRSASVLLEWRDSKPEFVEPVWEKLFAPDPTASIHLQQRAVIPVQAGSLPAPFPTHTQRLVFEQTHWFALAISEGKQEPLTLIRARAQLAQTHLWLEFRSQSPHALSIWQHTLASLHVEPHA